MQTPQSKASTMSMNAFKGDAHLKSEMLDRVRSKSDAGQLITASVLRWMPDQSLFSVCGALVESGDNDVFVERSGIPIALALLCEGIVGMTTVTIPDKSRAIGYEFRGHPELNRFALEWLDAVRPGADLSGVLPRYMVEFLAFMLSADFDQAPFISPAMRLVAERILANWTRELAGETIDQKSWRGLRADAVAATEMISEAWAYPIAHFIETLAWPVRDVAGEFMQPYSFVCTNWLAFVQRPYLAEEDRRIAELSLKGHLLAKQEEERTGPLSTEAYSALLDANPDIKAAMMFHTDPVTNARVKEGQLRAFEATVPRMRRLMDRLLALIAAA